MHIKKLRTYGPEFFYVRRVSPLRGETLRTSCHEVRLKSDKAISLRKWLYRTLKTINMIHIGVTTKPI